MRKIKEEPKTSMWEEIKAVWHTQWQSAKDAWQKAWQGSKSAIYSAIYAIANFIWATIQTVIFLPFKTALYETGKILVKYLIKWIAKI